MFTILNDQFIRITNGQIVRLLFDLSISCETTVYGKLACGKYVKISGLTVKFLDELPYDDSLEHDNIFTLCSTNVSNDKPHHGRLCIEKNKNSFIVLNENEKISIDDDIKLYFGDITFNYVKTLPVKPNIFVRLFNWLKPKKPNNRRYIKIDDIRGEPSTTQEIQCYDVRGFDAYYDEHEHVQCNNGNYILLSELDKMTTVPNLPSYTISKNKIEDQQRNFDLCGFYINKDTPWNKPDINKQNIFIKTIINIFCLFKTLFIFNKSNQIELPEIEIAYKVLSNRDNDINNCPKNKNKTQEVNELVNSHSNNKNDRIIKTNDVHVVKKNIHEPVSEHNYKIIGKILRKRAKN